MADDISANVSCISHMDFPGAGQVEVIGDCAYIGHMDPPHGTSVLDISDPKNPRLLEHVRTGGIGTHRLNGIDIPEWRG